MPVIYTKTCQICQKSYSVSSRNEASRKNKGIINTFCSRTCFNLHQSNLKIDVSCQHCGTLFKRVKSQFLKFRNHFCSKSCSATFTNTHKIKGTVRSKLEQWLETKLVELYPALLIQFNKKDTIGSELDIYIPSLKLAFELNGIFHYEPIFGANKLQQIQFNDTNKFQKCQELGISLCIIDTSSQKYFKEQTSKKFLDIIVSVISQANAC